ncbi:MAG: hypothetical protein M3162_05035 [Thermoproteota archaeon]|nr:hypothetical protein [Thermoproteota archaeon]
MRNIFLEYYSKQIVYRQAPSHETMPIAVVARYNLEPSDSKTVVDS